VIFASFFEKKRKKRLDLSAKKIDVYSNNPGIEIPFVELLCCTNCAHDLSVDESMLTCDYCGEKYPVKDGVPLFSADYIESNGQGASAEKRHRSNIGAFLPLLKKAYLFLMPPSFPMLQRGEDKLAKHIFEQYEANKKAFIVDIGAGSKRWADVMSVDVFNYPGIDYCAYAEKLPFKDNSVDMIISSSAIEHFRSMRKVYDEFVRVIKPGGMIFISAPFVYPFHAEPSDYHRWSANGLIDDFSEFELIDSGGYAGPHSAVHSVLSSYFSWMFSFGNRSVYMVMNLIFGWLLFPLQIADRLRGQYGKSTPLDAIVYFIGKKK
jgi:SAM-dependent methyltransferase